MTRPCMPRFKSVTVVHPSTFWGQSVKISHRVLESSSIARIRCLMTLNLLIEIILEQQLRNANNPVTINCMILGINMLIIVDLRENQ